ncbi:hypothetical protein ABEB36_014112 [Hypothenemus hampei]|uniref:C2H2-type domain-containing protein n=1 Tax=Hypothenemus hampei TaxID=57062 RepID=A0ABD1E3B7_HYPHA
MNFAPFGVPLSAALPVATQFSAGKITQSVTTPNGQVVGVLQGGENGIHYIRPLDASAFTTQSQAPNSPTGGQQGQTVITLPITMPGSKPGDPQQTVQIQVVNPTQTNEGNSPKYQISQIPIQTFGQGATVLTVAYNGNQEGLQILDGQSGLEGMTVVAAIQPQDIQLLQAQIEQQQAPQQQQQDKDDEDKNGDQQPMPVALIKTEMCKDVEISSQQTENETAIHVPAQYLQNVSSLQDYLQKVQTAQTLPLTTLHQFLKFNGTPEIKRELITEDGVIETVSIANADDQFNLQEHLIMNNISTEMSQEDAAPEDGNDKSKKKKKYKKKPPKPKKPKPGQVHIATALDGTTLFCCPECHMAYPEKELLEQHLVGHKIERRFICDICGAGLKRKEHLERHKLGHNPERPFVCSVCMKGFKRKEHLNLHFVIHSGEKTEICGECGKGFYRKDHLRKHTRSHITRRAKEQAERAQAILKAGGTPEDVQNELGATLPNGTAHAQVTIQVGTGGPNSQIQIPVQIQVPQHTIQLGSNESDSNQIQMKIIRMRDFP